MKHRTWLPTGFSASLTGGGVAGTWIESDAHICQKLVAHIEDKRFMFEDPYREQFEHVFLSVQDVRKYAVAARFEPQSKSAQEAIKDIATACREYVAATGGTPDRMLIQELFDLQARIGASLFALVEKYDLECDLDLSKYRADGVEILEAWMRDDPYELASDFHD